MVTPSTQRRAHRFFAVVTVAALIGVAVQVVSRLLNREVPIDQATGLLTTLLMAALAAVLGGSAFLLRPESGTRRALKLTSAVWSIALALALVALWWFAWFRPSGDEVEGTLVLDQQQTEAYLEANGIADQQVHPRIPTGVTLLSFEFTSSNDVRASGFVWQKFDSSVPADVKRGVVLPEGSDAFDLTLAWEDEYSDYAVMGWYFDKSFRQQFDYADYPFDRQSFWIRVWSLDSEIPVVLTPDFTSYAPWVKILLQGLDPQIVVGGWDPIYTAFSMKVHDYGNAFGRQSPTLKTPDLYFNVVMKRDVLQPLIKHLPFTIVIASLLFATLLMTSRNDDRKGRFGLTTAGVVGASGALVLTVILEHGNIRGVVGSQQLSYIEVLPFTLYLMIALVTVNAILVDDGSPRYVIDYEDNLLPVVLFWPLLLAVLVVVTWVTLF